MFSIPTVPAQYQVYACLGFAEVIFGVWPLVASVAMKEGFDPVVFALYRCAGSSVLLLAASWILEGYLPIVPLSMPSTKMLGLSVRQVYADRLKQLPWPHFMVLGALMCCNVLGYIIGVQLTSGTQAALMQPIVPVVACLVGVIAGHETLNTSKLMGIMVSVVGAMYVVYVGQEEADKHGAKSERKYQLGTLALMVNVISVSFYFVLQNFLLRKYPPVFITSVSTLVATGYLILVACFYFEEWGLSSWRNLILTPKREAALAYGIMFTTALNFVILAKANKATSPSTVTSFSTLQPLITTIVSIVFFGIYPCLQTVYGGIAIVAGLLITVRAQLAESTTVEEDKSLL
jgi:drug/metabolite transporter (DMT)-like permease